MLKMLPPCLLLALQALPVLLYTHPSQLLSLWLLLTGNDCQVHDNLISECRWQLRGNQTLEDTERSKRTGFGLSPLESGSDGKGQEVEADGSCLVFSQGLYWGV